MNEARRAGRLRRAPKNVIGDDNSEPIAGPPQFQDNSIAALTVYDGLRQIGRIELACAGKSAIAFTPEGTRLGEFPNEAAAMRIIKNSAKAKERRVSTSMTGCAHHRPDRAGSI